MRCVGEAIVCDPMGIVMNFAWKGLAKDVLCIGISHPIFMLTRRDYRFWLGMCWSVPSFAIKCPLGTIAGTDVDAWVAVKILGALLPAQLGLV